jgi:DNA-binding FadR family transcriptional regulator
MGAFARPGPRGGALGVNELSRKVQKKESAVASAAEKLRHLSMEKGDGEFIGSEEDLIAILEVSRPTLRQASALVLQENLISVKRGVGGGYFACVPNSMTVSRMAALYLQSRAIHLPDVHQALKPLRTEIAGLAARNVDEISRESLVKFVEAEENDLKSGVEATYRAFLASEREFGRIVGELSLNDILNLFLNVIYDLAPFTRRDEDVWVNRPERVDAYRRQRMQLAKAILEGDEEIAKVASGRCSQLILGWMQADSGSAAS